MISTKKKFSCVGFDVFMNYDDVCNVYTVIVRHERSLGRFFYRDYKTKGSATRSYDSWVSKLSAVDTRFANVR